MYTNCRNVVSLNEISIFSFPWNTSKLAANATKYYSVDISEEYIPHKAQLILKVYWDICLFWSPPGRYISNV